MDDWKRARCSERFPSTAARDRHLRGVAPHGSGSGARFERRGGDPAHRLGADAGHPLPAHCHQATGRCSPGYLRFGGRDHLSSLATFGIWRLRSRGNAVHLAPFGPHRTASASGACSRVRSASSSARTAWLSVLNGMQFPIDALKPRSLAQFAHPVSRAATVSEKAVDCALCHCAQPVNASGEFIAGA